MKFPSVVHLSVMLIAAVLTINVSSLQAQNASTLPPAQVGVEYTAELKAEGDKPPFKWSLVRGALPPGLELSDNGTIHGTSSAATQSPMVFTVKLSDSSNPPRETVMQLSLSVSAAHAGLRIVLPSGGKKVSQDVLNPATFIRIYEDPKSGKRQIVYDPSKKGLERHLQGTADEGSTIVILPIAGLMGDDVALNKLFITAKLASGDSSKDVPVIGYSEIGKDKATMASQTATAFE
ncbi:MAG TPA: Ig domain-containing protein, partial [Candidatus Angelobacter sp.]